MQYRFLIYISYSYSIPIGIPLEKEINKRDFDVFWFSDLEEGRIALKQKTNTLLTINDVIDYKPHIILTATNNIPDFIDALKVQVFHGFHAEKRLSKKNGFTYFNIRGFFDLYCTQGPSTTKVFKEQAKKYPHFDIIETGWAKIDPLFPLIKKQPDKIPTVMIASTFTERLSLACNNEVFNEIKRLTKTKKYHFIMVLHPKIPEHIVTKWKTLSNDYFKFYNTTELIPLFQKSDILFADTTSAIQEFLLQKKPVATFNHTSNHNYLINITEVKHIENALIKALSPSESLLNNIDQYINKLHPYFDGKSSERIIEATISFLHADKSHLKRKPLNLIRKFKIRKLLNHFTFKSYNKPFTIK